MTAEGGFENPQFEPDDWRNKHVDDDDDDDDDELKAQSFSKVSQSNFQALLGLQLNKF